MINKRFNKIVYERCKKFGHVDRLRSPSNKGWHYKITLPRNVDIKRTFEIRFYCYDDQWRLIKDMLRYMRGAKLIDITFDKKSKKITKLDLRELMVNHGR